MILPSAVKRKTYLYSTLHVYCDNYSVPIIQENDLPSEKAL